MSSTGTTRVLQRRAGHGARAGIQSLRSTLSPFSPAENMVLPLPRFGRFRFSLRLRTNFPHFCKLFQRRGVCAVPFLSAAVRSAPRSGRLSAGGGLRNENGYRVAPAPRGKPGASRAVTRTICENRKWKSATSGGKFRAGRPDTAMLLVRGEQIDGRDIQRPDMAGLQLPRKASLACGTGRGLRRSPASPAAQRVEPVFPRCRVHLPP